MVGEYIKKIREEKDLSINQLALYSDVSAAHISRIERGLRDPSPDILKKISGALKVPYEELMVQAGYLNEEADHTVLYVQYLYQITGIIRLLSSGAFSFIKTKKTRQPKPAG